jgi:glutathione S-transferase
MTTLYHSPNSRSSAVAALVRELQADVEIRVVSIPRMDGTGGADAANPHFEKKVPYLVDGAEEVHERGAIMAYLTDRFPAAGLGPLPGEAGRGAYLSWLSYYQGVMEPVILMQYAGVTHPAVHAAIRDFDTMMERLDATLSRGPWLLGDRYSAADLLCSSPFLWFSEMAEGWPVVKDWVARCAARPGMVATQAADREAMAA